MRTVEVVATENADIAYFYRGGLPQTTRFLTPDAAPLQVGFIVKSSNDTVPRHDHAPVERRLTGTAEVLVVMKGEGEVDLYDENRRFLSTHPIGSGDVLVLLTGGHAFRFSEDTVLLEVKQGPYPGRDEKETF